MHEPHGHGAVRGGWRPSTSATTTAATAVSADEDSSNSDEEFHDGALSGGSSAAVGMASLTALQAQLAALTDRNTALVVENAKLSQEIATPPPARKASGNGSAGGITRASDVIGKNGHSSNGGSHSSNGDERRSERQAQQLDRAVAAVATLRRQLAGERSQREAAEARAEAAQAELDEMVGIAEAQAAAVGAMQAQVDTAVQAAHAAAEGQAAKMRQHIVQLKQELEAARSAAAAAVAAKETTAASADAAGGGLEQQLSGALASCRQLQAKLQAAEARAVVAEADAAKANARLRSMSAGLAATRALPSRVWGGAASLGRAAWGLVAMALARLLLLSKHLWSRLRHGAGATQVCVCVERAFICCTHMLAAVSGCATSSSDCCSEGDDRHVQATHVLA